jgi:hypothetical protein
MNFRNKPLLSSKLYMSVIKRNSEIDEFRRSTREAKTVGILALPTISRLHIKERALQLSGLISCKSPALNYLNSSHIVDSVDDEQSNMGQNSSQP